MITTSMIIPMKKIPSIAKLFKVKQDGFTLIEILIAIAIVSVLMSVIAMNIPNHDARQFKNDTSHLVTLMNLAHEESLMNGRPLHLRIDQSGWKFFYLDANGLAFNHDHLNMIPKGLNESLLGNRALNKLPDIYKAQLWSKPISVMSIELVLGEELSDEKKVIKLTQDTRNITIYRNRYGYFEVINE